MDSSLLPPHELPSPDEPPREPAPLARDFAWRVHAAQEHWISRIDAKASVVLAFEGALVVLALTRQMLGTREGAPTVAASLGLVGIGLLIAGIVCAGAVVWPFVGSARRLRHDSESQLIYFGHVRHASAERLVQQLRKLSAADELGMLSRQIVSAGRINWRKHRLIQWSLVFALVAMALLATIAVLPVLAPSAQI